MDWYNVFVIGLIRLFITMLRKEFTLWIGAAIWILTSVVIDMRTITLRFNRTYASLPKVERISAVRQNTANAAFGNDIIGNI